jgi:hypothetical protein
MGIAILIALLKNSSFQHIKSAGSPRRRVQLWWWTQYFWGDLKDLELHAHHGE